MKYHKAETPKSSPLLKPGEKVKAPVDRTYGTVPGVKVPPTVGAGGYRGDGISKADFDRAYGRK